MLPIVSTVLHSFLFFSFFNLSSFYNFEPLIFSIDMLIKSELVPFVIISQYGSYRTLNITSQDFHGSVAFTSSLLKVCAESRKQQTSLLARNGVFNFSLTYYEKLCSVLSLL